MRDEQLLWYRHRCKNLTRFPYETRRASGEMSIAREKLHVVWRVGLKAIAPKNLQELGATRAIGMRWSAHTIAFVAGHCDIEHSELYGWHQLLGWNQRG